jgi:hypothetical protein
VSEDQADLLSALKAAGEWVEFVALQCSYYECTPENCGSKRAEIVLTQIDRAIERHSADPGIPVYRVNDGGDT